MASCKFQGGDAVHVMEDKSASHFVFFSNNIPTKFPKSKPITSCESNHLSPSHQS